MGALKQIVLPAALLVLALLLPGTAAGADLNYYEWSAVSREIVVARVLGEEGRNPIAVVEQSLKGDLQPEDEFLIGLRAANRQRMSHQRKLRLLHGNRYLLLMERNESSEKRWPLYDLVRGVEGARVLPPEGEQAVLDALRTFVDLHRIEDHDRLWEEHAGLLESVNPVVLETVLDQYIKFRRGIPELIPSVLPLSSHPSPEIRARAATLIGQIYQDVPPVPEQQDPEVAGQLIALARRDRNIQVRVAATRAVSRLPGEEPLKVLERIATDDPDQLVRYTAQELLLAGKRQEQ